MEDQTLINKIQSLKAIKPSREWQVKTEMDILGYKPKVWDGISFPSVNLLQPRYAIAFGLIFIAIMSSLAFGLVPGLNQQEMVTKYGYAGLANNLDKSSSFYLDYAAKNLQLLKDGKIKDTEAVVQGVKLALERAQAKLPTKVSSVKESTKLVEKINNVETQLNSVRATLGSEVDGIDAEMQNVKTSTQIIIEKEIYRLTAKGEINELENSTLTEEQKALFQEAKELFNIGKYQESLEKILELSNESGN
ncbi:MAG: hypothetical protein WC309_01350 [Candidatus Paceibacterota bacterium]|jgi:hypothetical protein|nr:hypothetical protein [Candidatus Paceibacterota bacterium]